MRRLQASMVVAYAGILVAVITGALVLHNQSVRVATLTKQNTELLLLTRSQDAKLQKLRSDQVQALHFEAVKACNGLHRIIVALRQIVRANAAVIPPLIPGLSIKLEALDRADCVVVKALPTSTKGP